MKVESLRSFCGKRASNLLGVQNWPFFPLFSVQHKQKKRKRGVVVLCARERCEKFINNERFSRRSIIIVFCVASFCCGFFFIDVFNLSACWPFFSRASFDSNFVAHFSNQRTRLLVVSEFLSTQTSRNYSVDVTHFSCNTEA